MRLRWFMALALAAQICCLGAEEQAQEVDAAPEQLHSHPVGAIPESVFKILDDGTVQVSVFLDVSNDRLLRKAEGKAMIAAHELLKKARPDIPAKYVVQGRILQNSKNRTTGIYTYIVEYSSASIASTISRAEEDAKKAAEEAARLEYDRKAAEETVNLSAEVNLKPLTKQEIVEKVEVAPAAKKKYINTSIDTSMSDFDIDE